MATTTSRRRRTLAPLNPPRTEVFNTSSRSKSALLKGTWRIDDAQTLEAGYRRYEGTAGEIMASQIIRVDRDRIPQWDPGHVDMDSYSLRYRFNPTASWSTCASMPRTPTPTA
jgi:hemoglobin/transferrin/lactoferrin receptor protein